MRKLCFIIAFLVTGVFLYSQSSYNDVVVIINSNNAASIEIGEYFAQQRNIPNQNLIYIETTSDEIVDTLTFYSIIDQIKSYFSENNLIDSINYIVTTKGIPLNIRTADSCGGITGAQYCSSFDSELALIFSEYEDGMISPGSVYNPYFETDVNFSRDEFGIYLVSRLDAYTTEQVLGIIDRSGPNRIVEKETAKIVFDISHCDEDVIDIYTDFFQFPIDYLVRNNWNVIFHIDTNMLTGESNVLGYANVYWQQGIEMPQFEWIDGSFASHMAVSGVLTMNEGQGDDILSVPDYIKDGASSGSGHTNLYYFSQSLRLENFYNHYLQDTADIKFNLAESYYSGIWTLSYQSVLVGDPKTSLLITHTGIDKNPQANFSISAYPVPNNGVFTLSISSKENQNLWLDVIDINGVPVVCEKHDIKSGINNIEIIISDFPSGVYSVVVRNSNGDLLGERIVKM